MDDGTATSTALLAGLRDGEDPAAWATFVSRHRPVLVAYGRRLGIPAADAEDVAQEALLAFAEALRDGRYDREKGRLRAWMHGIAHNVVRNWLRRHARRGEVQAAERDGETGFFARIADEDAAAAWEQEWNRELLRVALDRAKDGFTPATMAAFERFALRGEPPELVARELGLSTNAVYIAKHRVLQRLRDARAELEALWR